jgi:hypothetical protein
MTDLSVYENAVMAERDNYNPAYVEWYRPRPNSREVAVVTAQKLGSFALREYGKPTIGRQFAANFERSFKNRWGIHKLQPYAVTGLRARNLIGIKADMTGSLVLGLIAQMNGDSEAGINIYKVGPQQTLFVAQFHNALHLDPTQAIALEEHFDLAEPGFDNRGDNL